MKKLVFFFAVTIVSGSVFSQAKLNDKKSMIKLNLSSFATKGVGLQYEYKVSKGITFALGYSTIPKGKVAFQSVIESSINDTNVNIGGIQLGTSILTPEVRFYVGKRGAFHGFYFAPYARISTYKMSFPIDIESTNKTVLFDGKLNNTTGGLLLGSNFKLSKSLYLDWWILGASAGSAKGTLVAATSLTPSEQTAFKDQLDGLDIALTTITSEVNAKGATIRTTGTMFGLRGLGFNLGIRF